MPLKLLPLAVLAFMTAGAAHAATLLNEDFSDEAIANGTVLNFTGFDQFSVSSGTVDLLDGTTYGISCATTGCVDLDGSTGNPGLLSTAIAFETGVTYTLSFTISGNQRNSASDTVRVGIDNGVLAATEYTKSGGDGFETLSTLFTVATNQKGSLFFEDLGSDNVGIILDRVSIMGETTPVPLPAGAPLLLGGLALLGFARRRARG